MFRDEPRYNDVLVTEQRQFGAYIDTVAVIQQYGTEHSRHQAQETFTVQPTRFERG